MLQWLRKSVQIICFFFNNETVCYYSTHSQLIIKEKLFIWVLIQRCLKLFWEHSTLRFILGNNVVVLMVLRNWTVWLYLLYNKSRCYSKPRVHLEMYAWKQIWQSKSRLHSPFVYENHRSSKTCLLSKPFIRLLFPYHYFLHHSIHQ